MKVISYDGHCINDGAEYTAGLTAESQSPPIASAVFVRRNGVRPLVGALAFEGVFLTMLVTLPSGGVLTKRERQVQLHQWFDNTVNEAARLVIADDDGISNLRYVMGVPVACVATANGDGNVFEVVLAAHGDVRWRSVTAATDSWSITASGQNKTLTNGGDDIAFPVFTITPTASKSGSYAYRRWLPIKWRVETAVSNYPVDVVDTFDTAALVTAGKMQADGDDLRIEVDGVEADRWLGGMDTTATRVWCNLTFVAQEVVTLAAAMLIGDAVETIDVNEDVSGFPNAGILLIGSEAFTYTAKNDSLKRFTGVSRAQKGTAAAGHSVSVDVEWIQHDVWMIYGNPSATAPSVDSDYEPVFNLSSTNTYLEYDTYSLISTRGGSWSFDNVRNTSAIAGNEIGIDRVTSGAPFEGRIKTYNPCGILSANFTIGVSIVDPSTELHIQSSVNGIVYVDEYTIPSASTSWARNETLAALSTYVALHMYTAAAVDSPDDYVSSDDVFLTLDGSKTPDITVNSEQGNYLLAATITNEETGESILLTYTTGLNETLQVNTDLKTVTDLENGSNQFQAVDPVGGTRLHWLRMPTGDNVFRFDDVGTAGVTIGVEWEERRYS